MVAGHANEDVESITSCQLKRASEQLLDRMTNCRSPRGRAFSDSQLGPDVGPVPALALAILVLVGPPRDSHFVEIKFNPPPPRAARRALVPVRFDQLRISSADPLNELARGLQLAGNGFFTGRPGGSGGQMSG